MAFLTGLVLLDAPASALNNTEAADNAATANTTAVKHIDVQGQGAFPYISAQAFRFWLRETLEHSPELCWKAAPIFREEKIAYTDANPIEYWDDDLFGYMRAQAKTKNDKKNKKNEKSRKAATPTTAEITRISPFRVSTFIALTPP